MKHVLLVDNFDSFTHNLAQALAGCGATVTIRRNDAIDPAGVDALDPSHVVISPGPGRPEHAGATEAIVRDSLGRRPLLGVCLGHQALVRVLGGRIGRAPEPVHGKTSRIEHVGDGLYAGLTSPMEVGRYHSLVATELPEELQLTAFSEDAVVMSVRHRLAYAFGLQFHPESLLTPQGTQLLERFLRPEIQVEEVGSAYRRDPELTEAIHTLYGWVLRGNPEVALRDTQSLLVARVHGVLVGFKAGHRQGRTFHSTSGAVNPGFRRLGVAAALMRAQHEAQAGLLRDGGEIRTSTLNVFRPMLLLNLAHGFQIDGVGAARFKRPAPYLHLVRRLGMQTIEAPEVRLAEQLCSIDPRSVGRLMQLLRQGYDVVGRRHVADGVHLLLERAVPSPFGPETYEAP